MAILWSQQFGFWSRRILIFTGYCSYGLHRSLCQRRKRRGTGRRLKRRRVIGADRGKKEKIGKWKRNHSDLSLLYFPLPSGFAVFITKSRWEVRADVRFALLHLHMQPVSTTTLSHFSALSLLSTNCANFSLYDLKKINLVFCAYGFQYCLFQ